MSTTIGANFTLLYPERVRALALCSWYELEGFPLLETPPQSASDVVCGLAPKNARDFAGTRARADSRIISRKLHAKLLPIFPPDKPAVRKKLVELFASHQPAHYVQSAEFYTSMPNLCAQMHHVKCPVLGICGTDDPSPDKPGAYGRRCKVSVRYGSRARAGSR